MTASYDDPVKQLSRERLRDFVAEHVLSYKKARDVRVVCFPGAEKHGEEALEVKEIYDPLGIPRENIVGLEYDNQNAQRLKQAGLGIEVVVADALDFFRSTNSSYDVISLDYLGQRTWKERDTAAYIAGRHLLRDRSVFATNHMIKREGQSIKQEYLEAALFPVYTHADLLSYLGTLREQIDAKEVDLDFLREGIINDYLRIFSEGTRALSPRNSPLLQSLPQEVLEKELHNLESQIQIMFNHYGFKRAEKGLQAIKHFYEEDCLDLERFKFTVKLLEQQGMNHEDASTLLNMTTSIDLNAYRTFAHDAVYYTSNKNANMLLNMMAIREIPARFANRSAQLLVLDHGYPRLNPELMKERKFQKLLGKYLEDARTLNHIDLQSPEYLGSSYSRQQEKETRRTISKEEAIALLRDGISPKHISESFAGFSKMQLAAFKAHHVTRRNEERT